MIALTLDLADMILAALAAMGAGAGARIYHSNAIDAAARAHAAATSKLAKSLRAARKQLAEIRPLADKAAELEKELARTKRALQAERVDNSKLTEANAKLEDEVQAKARYVAETLEDFDFVDNALSDAVGFARTASDEQIRRDVLERITLAHIFDAVDDGRGPLLPWAKAMRLGPFQSDLPKPILDQAYDILEALGVMEQFKYPRSLGQQMMEETAAKAAAPAPIKHGGGKK